MSSPAVRALGASARVQFRNTPAVHVVVSGVLQPLAFAVVALLADRGTSADPATLVLGAGLLGLWSSVLWQASFALRTEVWQGTLAGILSRPAGFAGVLLGKSAVGAVCGAVPVTLTCALLLVVLRVPLPVAHPVEFVVAAVSAVVAAVPLSVLLASSFLLTRSAARLSENLAYPVFILSGMFVPLGVLPGWLRPVASVFPYRWSADLFTATRLGGRTGPDWLWFAVTAAGWSALAAAAVAAVLHRARRAGTLELG
ncbi:ABC transporter permease [Amycolatopsis sp. NBC_00345]|uniref:ABC transporter permease n=1 Tax=Amycolatopsis sp. NBC_00345 TaxID=2975955 RepID=UPI002E252E97